MGLGGASLCFFNPCGVPFPARLWWWVHGCRGRVPWAKQKTEGP
jgi:hypothetical protein